MDAEKKIEKEINSYQELAKENKNIDLTALMLNALETQNRNLVSAKQKKWAYLVSVGLPPLGLLYALKYYFANKDDGHHVAKVCVVLTILSGLSIWLIGAMIFSGSGADLNQIQQIRPDDIQQFLK